MEWLKTGGKFEDIDKIKREKYGSWGDAVTQKYVIDMLPIGKTSNAYFHRNKGLISQNLSGIDFLSSVNEEVKFFAKKAGIEIIQWGIWKGCICLIVHSQEGKEIILTTPPLTEVVQLETDGKLNNPGDLRGEGEEIMVTTSFNQDGSPKESMKIWRSAPSAQSLSYMNALGSVSFSVLNFEVEY